MATTTLSSPNTVPVRNRPRYQRFDSSRIVGKMSVEEWTVYLEKSKHKSDYVNGEVVIVAGASPEHNLIQMNVGRAIGNALEAIESECEVFGSDQKVQVASNIYYFPDLVVVCGAWQVDLREGLQNPAAIIEILSPTTEIDDRTDKFLDYQKISTLHHYLLIDQFRVAVTHYEKRSDGLWVIAGDYRTLTDIVTLTFGETKLALPLSRIYRRVDMSNTTPEISATE